MRPERLGQFKNHLIGYRTRDRCRIVYVVNHTHEFSAIVHVVNCKSVQCKMHKACSVVLYSDIVLHKNK
jgi:hypothetical protein